MNAFDQSMPFQNDEENATSLGRIVSVTGSQAIVMLQTENGSVVNGENRPDMGTLLRIDAVRSVTLGLISGLSVPAPSTGNTNEEIWIAEIELVGELVKNEQGVADAFRRGVSAYPRLGDEVFLASKKELALAYSWGSSDTIEIGTISQAPDISAVVRLDDLLGKHFAILGTTGAGKSYSTALVLRQIVTKKTQAHILLLDPHNEYANSFDGMAEIITPTDLQLPYWLLNFEEIIEIVVGEKGSREEQIEILGDIIPIAKKRYQNAGRSRSGELLRSKGGGQVAYTVDTPTPYRLSDLLDILNEAMGKLETKKTLGPYKALKMRIESLSQDPRYNFMFGALSVQDHMNEILGRIFRIPVDSRPLTILEMTGLPSEVVNVVVSVLARLSFDIAQWSEGMIPITLVCEEAHRYIPNDKNSGFGPTRKAIAKIAKEGRKYGVSLAIITQRPSELDPTILSQCNTVFAMRMSNENDQNIVSAGISDAGASMLAFLPSLGTGEAIAFGDGVTLPSRLRFSQLPASALPRGQTASFSERWNSELASNDILGAIIEKWRTIGAGPSMASKDQMFEDAYVTPSGEEQYQGEQYQQQGAEMYADPAAMQHQVAHQMGGEMAYGAPEAMVPQYAGQPYMSENANMYGQMEPAPGMVPSDRRENRGHLSPENMDPMQAQMQRQQQQYAQQPTDVYANTATSMTSQPYVPPEPESVEAPVQTTATSIREAVMGQPEPEAPVKKSSFASRLLRKRG